MMLNKFAEWRTRVLEDSIENNKGNTFNVYVIFSKIDNHYHICGSVNDSSAVWVSSQRQDKRAFKSLDTIKKLFSDLDIVHFTVVG